MGKILVINPILYTSETKRIKRIKTVKDSMICDLCLAFSNAGHEVTLFAAEPFRPTENDVFPFSIIWGKCIWPSLFLPHKFPVMPELIRYIIKNRRNIDLVITGEVFSANSLFASLLANRKVIIWHELAKHNAMLKQIPSKIWYNIIARVCMRNTCVVARSEEAREFISRYCKNTQKTVIDHGVNLDKFKIAEKKRNSLAVCSQLIPRKRIDGIIMHFRDYLKVSGDDIILYIIGDGPLRDSLEELCNQLGIQNNVVFTGKLAHAELCNYLAEAKAMLVNTEKDNSMISIVEAIASGTPVITTDVPLNASYIKKYQLGIVKDWSAGEIEEIIENNAFYVRNCLAYRHFLSTDERVKQFLSIIGSYEIG